MQPVTIRGRYFYRDGARFLVSGVVYQLHNANVRNHIDSGLAPIKDPLAEENLPLLERCLPLFRELELNCLFIFWIDPSRNHDAAMVLLAKAGIYVLVGLSDLHHAISRNEPLASYSAENLQHAFEVVDAMSVYTNTLGLFVGNENVNSPAHTAEVPRVLRAMTRDLKMYMRHSQQVLAELPGGDFECGDSEEGLRQDMQQSEDRNHSSRSKRRVLPLGYSASDVAHLRKEMFEYCVAGPEEEAMDFYALNNYSWVGDVSIKIAGWDYLERAFRHTPVPVFFSEYGAQIGLPREFHETARGVYDPFMSRTFSGGIVYEFLMGASGYGLVKLRRLRPVLPPAVDGDAHGDGQVASAKDVRDGSGGSESEGNREGCDVGLSEAMERLSLEARNAVESVTAISTSTSMANDDNKGSENTHLSSDNPNANSNKTTLANENAGSKSVTAAATDNGENDEDDDTGSAVSDISSEIYQSAVNKKPATAIEQDTYVTSDPDAGITEILQKLPDFENLRKALASCRELRNPRVPAPPSLLGPASQPPSLASFSFSAPTPTSTGAAGQTDTNVPAASPTEEQERGGQTLPRPSFPQMSNAWRASPDGVLPPCPLDWDEVRAQIVADREWVDVGELVGGLSLGADGDA